MPWEDPSMPWEDPSMPREAIAQPAPPLAWRSVVQGYGSTVETFCSENRSKRFGHLCPEHRWQARPVAWATWELLPSGESLGW